VLLVVVVLVDDVVVVVVVEVVVFELVATEAYMNYFDKEFKKILKHR
jgi:hypothetical protein